MLHDRIRRPDGRASSRSSSGASARLALEDCYRAIMEPYLQERYMPFDVRVTPYEETLDRNLYISLEAMRGHLVGPGRRGDIELRGAGRSLA